MSGMGGIQLQRQYPRSAMPVFRSSPSAPRFGQLNTWHYRVANILEASITLPGLKHPLTVLSPLANPQQAWFDITLNSSEAFGQALVPRSRFSVNELKPHGFNSHNDMFIQLYRKPTEAPRPARRHQQEAARHHAGGLLDFQPIPSDDPVYGSIRTDLRELCDTFEATHQWPMVDPTDDYKEPPTPPPPGEGYRRGRRRGPEN